MLLTWRDIEYQVAFVGFRQFSGCLSMVLDEVVVVLAGCVFYH